jgi:hypothetical protein
MSRSRDENLDELMELEALDLCARRPWVKPTLESLSLKDALCTPMAPGCDGPLAS